MCFVLKIILWKNNGMICGDSEIKQLIQSNFKRKTPS